MAKSLLPLTYKEELVNEPIVASVSVKTSLSYFIVAPKYIVPSVLPDMVIGTVIVVPGAAELEPIVIVASLPAEMFNGRTKVKISIAAKKIENFLCHVLVFFIFPY
jgi:hypothetical protein